MKRIVQIIITVALTSLVTVFIMSRYFQFGPAAPSPVSTPICQGL